MRHWMGRRHYYVHERGHYRYLFASEPQMLRGVSSFRALGVTPGSHLTNNPATDRTPDPFPSFAPAAISPSDFNSDGRVDFSDFLDFVENFGKSEAADSDFDAKFDLTEDGRVDFSDFLDFVAAFGK